VTQPDQPQSVENAELLAQAWERHRAHLFEGARPVSEWLVDQIDPRPGQTILELAAGPGETGFLAAERIGTEGRLVSSDLSSGMVEAAQRGAEARGLSKST
jgi:ubiquinone/menaquinone biosynthesis C-methylase UbiE